MEMNRNHFFTIGVVILLLGIKFRLVESVVLNEKTSQFVAQRLKKQESPAIPNLLSASYPGKSLSADQRVIRPPNWIGWALVSAGGVMLLQSLIMRKPGAG